MNSQLISTADVVCVYIPPNVPDEFSVEHADVVCVYIPPNVLDEFSVDEHADVVCVYIPPNVLDEFSVDEHADVVCVYIAATCGPAGLLSVILLFWLSISCMVLSPRRWNPSNCYKLKTLHL